MGIFDKLKGKVGLGVVDNTPKPVGEAVKGADGIWRQDYSITENGHLITKRYQYDGTSWIEDVASNINTDPKPLGEDVQGADGIWRQDYSVYEGNKWVNKKYKYDGNNWIEDVVSTNAHGGEYESLTGKVDLTKNIPNTTAGINLKKSTINLDKSLVDLSKKSGVNLAKHRARVAVVMDYSGSMRRQYADGSVQRLLTRLMPLALRFDDNGELDVWVFDNNSTEMPGMTLTNFDNYVKTATRSMEEPKYGTEYAPVIKDVLDYYFVDNIDNSCPSFVIFITDGANSDERASERVIRESANKDVFIQFVGIGTESFRFLEKLDDLTGRPVDNTGFIKVRDFDKITDNEVYDKLLAQYPDWLKAKGWR